MNVVSLPYLFSPANIAQAGSFLEGFRSLPAEGRLLHPEIAGHPTPQAAAAAVLGSALRLAEEGQSGVAGWNRVTCQPYAVKNASDYFRFEDGINPRLFGGDAAFENRFGRFVAVSWRQEDLLELKVGWAWEGVMAMHAASFSPSGDRPVSTAYDIEFEGPMALSLRRFLNVEDKGMEPILRRIADLVIGSGLAVSGGAEPALVYEKGEPSPWTPMRMDSYALPLVRSLPDVLVSLLGFAIVSPQEEVLVEKVGLRLAFLPSETVSESPVLPPLLMPLWDLAESLSMARMKGTAGLPS